jgi:hypothetical protein
MLGLSRVWQTEKKTCRRFPFDDVKAEDQTSNSGPWCNTGMPRNDFECGDKDKIVNLLPRVELLPSTSQVHKCCDRICLGTSPL